MSSASDLLQELSRLCASAPPELQERLTAVLSTTTETVRAEVATVATSRQLQSIALYGDRADRSETAIAFFTSRYADLVASGEFYADDLRHHDARLYSALSAYLALRGQTLGDLMPIRSSYRPGRLRRGQALAKAG